MNLIEFSKISNQSIDDLKELLMIQFNRIVLSEYVDLDEKVLHELMDYFGISQIDSVSHANLPEEDFEKQGFSSVPTDEEQCFRELSDILHPEIKYTRKLLEYCSEHNYLFFIDTCSLLNQYFYDFFNMFDKTVQSNSSLYIPYVVLEELKKICIDKKKDDEVVEKARRIFDFILQKCQQNRMKIIGDEEDKRTNERGEKVVHADRVMLEKLIYFRNDSQSCMLITQDYGLTVDALQQNESHSSKSSALVLVKKIGKGGALLDNTDDVKNPKLPIDHA